VRQNQICGGKDTIMFFILQPVFFFYFLVVHVLAYVVGDYLLRCGLLLPRRLAASAILVKGVAVCPKAFRHAPQKEAQEVFSEMPQKKSRNKND
jgi:hypothetical protein